MDFPDISEERRGVKKTLTEGGLPELTGAPEEIEAAEPIRSRALIAADDLLTDLRAREAEHEERSHSFRDPNPRPPDPQVHSAQAALNRLRHETSAAWWLQQAQRTPQELLTQMLPGEPQQVSPKSQTATLPSWDTIPSELQAEQRLRER